MKNLRTKGLTLQRLLGHLGQIFFYHPENEGLQQIVYRRSSARYSSDPWKRAVFQQCHGQSVGNIVNALYLDELRRGAWLVDIGIWKSLFDRTVLTAIRELADEGYIYLSAAGENLTGTATTEAKNRNGIPGLKDVEMLRPANSTERLTIGSTGKAAVPREIHHVPESDVNVGNALE